MKVIGNRSVDETTTEVGRKFYLDMYSMPPEEMIRRHKLEYHSIPQTKAVVHLEYEGSIAHAILIEEGDKAWVYGQGCYGLPFNTDGQAFLEVAPKDGVTVRQFCYDNSPYQLTLDDENDEWYQLDDELNLGLETIEDIAQHFVGEVNGLFDTNLIFEEIIFVRML